MCTIESEIVTIPHGYVREWQVYDKEIRFVMKTGLKCFLVPVEEDETEVIFDSVLIAQKSMPFCLQVRFPF